MSAEDLADVVQIQHYMDLVNPQGGGVGIPDDRDRSFRFIVTDDSGLS